MKLAEYAQREKKVGRLGLSERSEISGRARKAGRVENAWKSSKSMRVEDQKMNEVQEEL